MMLVVHRSQGRNNSIKASAKEFIQLYQYLMKQYFPPRIMLGSSFDYCSETSLSSKMIQDL